jgi:hypothetical protein
MAPHTARTPAARAACPLPPSQVPAVTGGGEGGFALVFQQDSTMALGLPDSGLGYASLPASFAIEFDMWQDIGLLDPSDNHISIHAMGTMPNVANEIAPQGVTACQTSGGKWYKNLPSAFYMKDTNQHMGKVLYDGVSNLLSVYVDDNFEPQLVCNVNFNQAMGAPARARVSD